MGVKLLFKEGIEADDIIGTLAKRFSEETIIVSGDRDVLQLVDPSTTVFHTKRGVTDIKIYTPTTLKEEGFTPEQIIEYKALAGDNSDNIPGCKGVGEKTAKDLLEKYVDVDGIYAHIEEIKGKLREKLESDKDNVYLSRDLATIETHAEIDCRLSDLTFNETLPAEAKAMMTSLEFKNLTSRFHYEEGAPTVEKREQKEFDRIKISDFSQGKELLSAVEKGTKVCVVYGREISVSFQNSTIIIPVAEGLFGDGLSEDEAVELIKPLFGKEYVSVFFDAKKDFYRLSDLGIRVEKPYEDVLVQAYLVNNTKIIKDAESLLVDYGFSGEKPSEELLSLHQVLSTKIVEKGLNKLYYNVELPLVECLYSMEKEGLTVDMNVLNDLDKTFSSEIEKLSADIHAIAEDDDFNINSTKQLAEILFDKLGLRPTKKNKTGYSVSAEVLEELEHPIVDALLRYRQLSKLKSTYIDGMKQVMNKATNRVHTDFKQCLTATGRLSSNEPNLQNIPVRTAEGREIRKMFVAKEGNVLISADYSQIELRLLAQFSQEPHLIDGYRNGVDVHATVRSRLSPRCSSRQAAAFRK